jgi:hypothetical protein
MRYYFWPYYVEVMMEILHQPKWIISVLTARDVSSPYPFPQWNHNKSQNAPNVEVFQVSHMLATKAKET